MATTAIHPGEHLAEELKILGMSAAELARKVDVPTNRITQILNGDRSITGDTALRLAPCALRMALAPARNSG
jgi:addiction module HigA family antidote